MIDWSAIGNHLAENLPDYLMVCATAWVGWMAARIAGGQSLIQQEIAEVERQRVRLDLFDRRVVVYQVIWGYISRVVQTGSKPAPEHENELVNLRPNILFLFGQEVLDFIDEARARAWEVHIANLDLAGIPPKDDASERLTRNLHWFTDAVAGLTTRFAPFLDFKKFRE